MDLSVVIGAYNEAVIARNSVQRLRDELIRAGLTFEIILVNDGSTDSTGRIFAELQRTFPEVRALGYACNRGKGYAIKAGILAATGDCVLYTDMDLAYPVTQIPHFARILRESGSDAVVGSRVLDGASFVVNAVSFRSIYWRYLTSRTFNLLARALLGITVSDTQCGLKCFRKDVAHAFAQKQRVSGFGFDVELLCIARQNRCAVRQVPVTVIHSPRRSTVRFAHAAGMFFDLFAIKWNQLRGAYRVRIPRQAS